MVLQVDNKAKIGAVIIAAIVIGCVLYFFVFNQEPVDPFEDLEYVNRENNFGLNPPNSWLVQDRADDASVILASIYYPPNNLTSFMQIDISISSTDSEITLDDQVENFLNNYFPQMNPQNFSQFTHKEITVNGMDAYEFKYTYNYTD